MTRDLIDLEFVRAASMAERIAGAGNAGYWLQCSGVNADHQRKAIKDALKELAALHGLVLVDAAEQQTIENLHAVIKDNHATIRRLMDGDSQFVTTLPQEQFDRFAAAVDAIEADTHAADAALAGIKSVQP